MEKAKTAATTYVDKAQFDVDIREWYDEQVFSPGQNILATLSLQKQECDFAIVLLTKDDFGEKKGEAVNCLGIILFLS